MTYAPELIDPETGEIIGDPAEVAQWQECIDSATWMMWALAGGKVHASECWIEDYSLRGSCEVNVLNQPLLTVERAEVVMPCVHGSGPLPIGFCVTGMNTVSFCCSGGGHPAMPWCGCGDSLIRLYYRTDSTIPPGTQGRVAWFANQCHLAQTGDKSCSLPERVTSVSRQGVSWTMLDPMDFLDKRLTGVGRLDTWLSVIRQVYPSATLIDPLKSQRRSSRRVDCCGAEFEPAAFGDLDLADPVLDPFPTSPGFATVTE